MEQRANREVMRWKLGARVILLLTYVTPVAAVIAFVVIFFSTGSILKALAGAALVLVAYLLLFILVIPHAPKA